MCSNGREVSRGTGPMLPGMARDGKMGYNLYSGDPTAEGSFPSKPFGEGKAHINVQPSITVNMWRRIN
jgi:hypothetical protein